MKVINHSAILSAILALSVVGCGKKQSPSTAASAASETQNDQQITGPTDGSSVVPGASLKNLPVIYFDYDQYTLNPEGRAILQTVAPELKSTPAKLIIEGHTDERGSNEYNLALGESRAKAVRDYLKKLGVPSDKVSVASFGEEKPSEVGGSESAWSKNRRAELNLNQ